MHSPGRPSARPLKAVNDITDYIVNFYNTIRRHFPLSYRSPHEYERAAD